MSTSEKVSTAGEPHVLTVEDMKALTTFNNAVRAATGRSALNWCPKDVAGKTVGTPLAEVPEGHIAYVDVVKNELLIVPEEKAEEAEQRMRDYYQQRVPPEGIPNVEEVLETLIPDAVLRELVSYEGQPVACDNPCLPLPWTATRWKGGALPVAIPREVPIPEQDASTSASGAAAAAASSEAPPCQSQSSRSDGAD